MLAAFEDGTSGGLFWLKWKSGDFRGQRLGQAFCNHFNLSERERKLVDNDTTRDLFYVSDEVAKPQIVKILERWQ